MTTFINLRFVHLGTQIWGSGIGLDGLDVDFSGIFGINVVTLLVVFSVYVTQNLDRGGGGGVSIFLSGEGLCNPNPVNLGENAIYEVTQ